MTIRLNTSGDAVDESITVDGRTLPIRFGEAEGRVFQVSIAGLSLKIGDFVTIEGDVAFDGNTFAGNNLQIFLGQGPAKLENGDINPLATGVLLSDATIGLLKNNDDGDYALTAVGTISVIGCHRRVAVRNGLGSAFNNTDAAVDMVLPIAGGHRRGPRRANRLCRQPIRRVHRHPISPSPSSVRNCEATSR